MCVRPRRLRMTSRLTIIVQRQGCCMRISIWYSPRLTCVILPDHDSQREQLRPSSANGRDYALHKSVNGVWLKHLFILLSLSGLGCASSLVRRMPSFANTGNLMAQLATVMSKAGTSEKKTMAGGLWRRGTCALPHCCSTARLHEAFPRP